MKVDPITVAARRIASLASQGRGITVAEAENYIRTECGDVTAVRAALTEACELWEFRGSRVWWNQTDPHLSELLDKWNAVLGRQRHEGIRVPKT